MVAFIGKSILALHCHVKRKQWKAISWTEKTRIYILTEKNLFDTKAQLHARPDCT